MNKLSKPIVLVILDGWGVHPKYAGNAISLSNTPFYNRLIEEYPSTTLRASGEAVGLPWGESGNSEVGHLNLGLGRILYQDLPRINKEIADKSFFSNPAFVAAVNHAKKNNSSLHIMGLASNGGVHASVDHLNALLLLASKNGLDKVFVHIFLDGRDTPLDAGLNYVKGVIRAMSEKGVGKIASVCGRYYAMDRNNNWDRTELAYNAIALGKGEVISDPVKAISESYRKKIYDEEFLPAVVFSDGRPVGTVSDNDALIFFNYRPDRARQISKAFSVENFKSFRRTFINNLFFVGFTEYDKSLPIETAFKPVTINNTLGDVLSANHLKQLRIAETEKYAHVTYFFNGGREDKSPGEDHVLVPSPSVSSYDQKPEMSAVPVTDKVVKALKKNAYDFILINYANADMVGHTGNLQAAVKAIETVDKCLERVVNTALDALGVVMITADHGNAEIMFNMQTGQIDKEHTANPVPFIMVGQEYQGKNFGWQKAAGTDLSAAFPQGILADVAPTVLEVMEIKKPSDMTGVSLLRG